MKISRLLSLALFLAGLTSVWAQNPAPKPGYTVLLETQYDEAGAPLETSVVESDDPTGEHLLEQIAISMVQKDALQPRVIDGKAVRFKARRPFSFPVEGDEGADANNNRPVLRSGQQIIPIYPENLARDGVVGGAIIEFTINMAMGTVKEVHTLRASHPEFGTAVETAVKRWMIVPREGPGMPAETKWRVAVAFTLFGKEPDLKWRIAPRPSIGGLIVGRGLVAPAATPAPAPAGTPAEPTK